MVNLADMERTISALDAVFKDSFTSRRQMARFFDATTDAIFFLNREYRFVFLNRKANELLASGGEDILGSVLFERYPNTVYDGSPMCSIHGKHGTQ
jgi:PAS domain-containing protein